MAALPDEQQLYEIAEAQAGYFTAKQAGAAGYSRQLLSHHAHAGNIQRVQHGIYRLTRFPHSPREDLYVAWLRCGPRAVISHDSALELYGLSDAMPTEIHVTVPRGPRCAGRASGCIPASCGLTKSPNGRVCP